MTPKQIADVLAKRARDGRVVGDAVARMRAREAATLAPTMRLLTPAQRAAHILNAYALGMFDDRADVGHYLDEVAGRTLAPAEREALRLVVRRASGRLVLGAFEYEAGGGGTDQLWTVRDGARTYTAWVYRKGSVLRARVTGGPRPRRRTPPPWPLFLAELFLDADGRTFRCPGCSRWYGRTHGRQGACSPPCARRVRRRRQDLSVRHSPTQ